MASVTIELPAREVQTRFNLRRWSEVLTDLELAKIQGRVETDRHGHVIMLPPPAPSHGSFQSEIAYLLRTRMQGGRVLTECPISTADGVKATDVAWASAKRMRGLGKKPFFKHAPEICVEVLSPSNTEAEMREKMALYFDAGAEEVWFCAGSGVMRFTAREGTHPLKRSSLCPAFPKKVRLV
jgi:Uma2 family endonuclease